MAVRIEKNGAVWTIVNSRIEARNAVDPESQLTAINALIHQMERHERAKNMPKEAESMRVEDIPNDVKMFNRWIEKLADDSGIHARVMLVQMVIVWIFAISDVDSFLAGELHGFIKRGSKSSKVVFLASILPNMVRRTFVSRFSGYEFIR